MVAFLCVPVVIGFSKDITQKWVLVKI